METILIHKLIVKKELGGFDVSEEKIGFVVSKEQAFFQIVNCIEGVYEEEFVALSAVYYSLIGEVIAYSETGTYQILSFESLSNAQQ